VLCPGTGNPDIDQGAWYPGESVPAPVGPERHCVADARGELVAEFVRHALPVEDELDAPR